MVGNQALIVAGVGCRRGCPANEIVALVRQAMALSGCQARMLAGPEFRADEAGLRTAADVLALPLRLIDRAALADAQARCLTRSERAEQATGLPSIAEAAALAAAGPGSVLVLPRIAAVRATCALARAS